MTGGAPASCACGVGEAYGLCCEPLHDGERSAATPEELMRSRYTAYALGRLDYVDRTWHPRTRPAQLSPTPDLRWTGLEIVAAQDDWVEFVATFTDNGAPGEMHERSRFTQRAGRWVYLDGDVD